VLEQVHGVARLIGQQQAAAQLQQGIVVVRVRTDDGAQQRDRLAGVALVLEDQRELTGRLEAHGVRGERLAVQPLGRIKIPTILGATRRQHNLIGHDVHPFVRAPAGDACAGGGGSTLCGACGLINRRLATYGPEWRIGIRSFPLRNPMALNCFFNACAALVMLGCAAQGAARSGHQDSPVRVRMETSKGEIVLELDREHAPISVGNFLKYAGRGVYDGTTFHRVVENFVIQIRAPSSRPVGALDAAEVEAIRGRLDRLDRASSHGTLDHRRAPHDRVRGRRPARPTWPRASAAIPSRSSSTCGS